MARGSMEDRLRVRKAQLQHTAFTLHEWKNKRESEEYGRSSLEKWKDKHMWKLGLQLKDELH